MLRVTRTAAQRIAQLLDDVTGRRHSEEVLRLAFRNGEQLTFTLSPIRRDDILVRCDGRVVLAVSPHLAESMSQLTIECDESERGGGVVARHNGHSE